jgi:hypothetical protein
MQVDPDVPGLATTADRVTVEDSRDVRCDAPNGVEVDHGGVRQYGRCRLDDGPTSPRHEPGQSKSHGRIQPGKPGPRDADARNHGNGP